MLFLILQAARVSHHGARMLRRPNKISRRKFRKLFKSISHGIENLLPRLLKKPCSPPFSGAEKWLLSYEQIFFREETTISLSRQLKIAFPKMPKVCFSFNNRHFSIDSWKFIFSMIGGEGE